MSCLEQDDALKRAVGRGLRTPRRHKAKSPRPALGGEQDDRAWCLVEIFVPTVDPKRHRETWHAGEGAFLVGGRWTVRRSPDPEAPCLSVVVHKGFGAPDPAPTIRPPQ